MAKELPASLGRCKMHGHGVCPGTLPHKGNVIGVSSKGCNVVLHPLQGDNLEKNKRQHKLWQVVFWTNKGN